MKRFVFVALALVLVFGLVFSGCGGSSVKMSPEEFYKGKTIRFIIPYGTGGGYDTWGRMIAPYIAKHTGAANAIPENISEGAGRVGQNMVYNDKNADGLMVALTGADEMAMSILLGNTEGMEFDWLKFAWLGRVTYEDAVLLANAKSPFTTIEGLVNAKTTIKAGGHEKLAAQLAGACLTASALNLNVKAILGYAGSKETTLALQRGEVDIATMSGASAVKLVGDEVKAVFIVGETRMPALPNVPTIFEAAKAANIPVTDEGAKFIKLWYTTRVLMRELFAPANTPADRVEFLRDAVEKMMNDPDFKAEVNKAKYETQYLRGDAAQKMAKETMDSLKSVNMAEFKKVLLEKYYK